MIRDLSRFKRNENGAVVVDHIPVFFAVTLIVLIMIELGIAHFLQLRAQKAVQLGARVAVSLPPAHADVPTINVPTSEIDGLNVPCYTTLPTILNGGNCVDPGNFQCRGTGCTGNDGVTIARIVQEMQRVEPSIDIDDVTITYVYRSLGNAGGPYRPEIVVNIGQRSYDFALLSLGPGVRTDNPAPFTKNIVADTVAHGPTTYGTAVDEAVIYSGIVASAISEGLFDSSTIASDTSSNPPPALTNNF